MFVLSHTSTDSFPFSFRACRSTPCTNTSAVSQRPHSARTKMDYINDVRSLRTEKADLQAEHAKLKTSLAKVEDALAQPGLAVDELQYLQNKESLIHRHLIAVRNDIAVVR
jgi:hypothetical protein